jgi:hypothetical protein
MDKDHYFRLLDAAFKNENTATSYKSRVNGILRVVGVESVAEVLKNPKISYPKIRDGYTNLNTRKNALTVLLTLFRLDASLKDSSAHGEWAKNHDALDGFQESKIKKSLPTEKQLKKYTPIEEIRMKYEDMKKRSDTHEKRATSQYYILLSIVLSMPPKRADFGKMRVYYNQDPNDGKSNYIVLNTNGTPSYMVFNRYKTSNVYARIDEELNRNLYRDIITSLRRHPRTHLFVNRDGTAFSTNNYFTKYVIACFDKFFGRGTGVTMLRHIYLTEKVSFDELSLEEQDDIARRMMHSSGLQDKYKWNKEKVCNMLNNACGLTL